MTINDILNGRKDARTFYHQLRGGTLQEASDEPLRLSDLRKTGDGCAPRQCLPSGKVVTYCGALCYYCLEDLLAKYTQREKPAAQAVEYMAGQMTRIYHKWSVRDLPTFVDMCVGSRIPTLGVNGQMEYKLITLDIPNIMDKVEAYDKMRPGKMVVQTSSKPTCRERPWNPDLEHMLFDGTPHEFESVEAAKRYWKSLPNYSNPSEKERVKSINGPYQALSKKDAKKCEM